MIGLVTGLVARTRSPESAKSPTFESASAVLQKMQNTGALVDVAGAVPPLPTASAAVQAFGQTLFARVAVYVQRQAPKTGDENKRFHPFFHRVVRWLLLGVAPKDLTVDTELKGVSARASASASPSATASASVGSSAGAGAGDDRADPVGDGKDLERASEECPPPLRERWKEFAPTFARHIFPGDSEGSGGEGGGARSGSGAPDFVRFHTAHTAANAVVVFELKAYRGKGGSFLPEHITQLIRYGRLLLRAQPLRQTAWLALTDTHVLTLLRVDRAPTPSGAAATTAAATAAAGAPDDGDGGGSVEYGVRRYAPVQLSSERGLELLFALLTADAKRLVALALTHPHPSPLRH